MSTTVNILIASRDRVESLRRTVRSVFRCRRPENATLHLVLVASGSRETELAANGLAKEAPPDMTVTVASLPRPGKTVALNHGLTLCFGDIVGFTDDDVELDEAWLEAAIQAFEDPATDGVQGRVDIRLAKGTTPRWWSRHCEALMASTTYLDARPSTALEDLNSCNMALRRTAIDRTWGFSPSLGPGVPSCPLGDDTEWSRRLFKSGCRFVYWPGMRVLHHLPVTRVRLAGLLYRSYLSGWMQAGAYPEFSPVEQAARSLSRLLVDGVRAIQRALQWRWPDAADRLLWMAREVGKLRALYLPHPARKKIS